MDEFIKTWGIGLTGGIATGKSTVGKIIGQAGFAVIDADHLARQAVLPATPGLAAIVQAFGPDILRADGSLDRQALAKMVFADPAAKSRLEAILHPEIARLLQKQLVEGSHTTRREPWFYEAALLFETGSYRRFRSIWVTWCPEPLQLSRLRERNHLSLPEAQRLLAQQMPAEAKKRRADVLIDTSGSLQDVAGATQEALQDLLSQLRKKR